MIFSSDFIHGCFKVSMFFRELVFVTILCSHYLSGHATGNEVYPVLNHEIQGRWIGSKWSPIDCEVQTIHSKLIPRKCLLLNISDVSIDILEQQELRNLGGIVIMLPAKTWSSQTIEIFNVIEDFILTHEVPITLYFTFEDENLSSIYQALANRAETNANTLSDVFSSIVATGFRFVTSIPSKGLGSAKLTNIEGRLTSNIDAKAPTVILCAHYDVLTSIPSFSYGAQAGATGVVALLEISRVLSQLFSEYNHHANYNLVFLLTGGSGYNFVGSKRWLDSTIQDSTGLALLDSVVQVVCLEALGSFEFGPNVFAHFSRRPRADSFTERFLRALNQSIRLNSLPPQFTSTGDQDALVDWVHKKINLSQESLAWEHERFSIYRLPALTLSSWPNSSVAHWSRYRATDGGPLHSLVSGDSNKSGTNYGSVNSAVLVRNIRVITEALARVLFGLDEAADEIHESPIVTKEWITEESVLPLLEFLTSHPRSPQLLDPSPASQSAGSSNLPTGKEIPGLLRGLKHLLHSFDVHVNIIDYSFSDEQIQPKANSDNGTPDSTNMHKESSVPSGSGVGIQPLPASVITGSAALQEIEVTVNNLLKSQKLFVYCLKSSSFDLLCSLVIVIYLTVLHLFLEHPSGFRKFAKCIGVECSKAD